MQQGVEPQYYDVFKLSTSLKTCQVCSSDFFQMQTLHFRSQIPNIPNLVYPVLKAQNSKRLRQARTNL